MGKTYRYTDSPYVSVDSAVAWEIVSDHERMSQWTPARTVVLETPGATERNGVGAVRAIHMFGPTIRERITAYEPPRLLRYELVSGLPFRDYTGAITIEPSGNGSRIFTAISFRTVFPGTQVLVALAIKSAGVGLARIARRRAR